jgi:quercetin dioxygenase-like cupin family protein
MNKLVLVFSTVLALSIFAITAQDEEGNEKAGAAPKSASLVSPEQLRWGPAPAGLPAGAQMVVLDGNPEKKGSFTVRLRMPDGYKIPPHTHPTIERVTVISGTAHLGMGPKFDQAAGQALSAGAFAVMPSGMQHFAWATGDTVVQIHSHGPFKINYVNPADDPRNAKQQSARQ